MLLFLGSSGSNYDVHKFDHEPPPEKLVYSVRILIQSVLYDIYRIITHLSYLPLLPSSHQTLPSPLSPPLFLAPSPPPYPSLYM